LSLRKKDFHFGESPVRVTLEAEITKTKEARESYISSEAVDKLKQIIDGKNDIEFLFHHFKDIVTAVNNEEQYFTSLRKRLADKDPDDRENKSIFRERYPNSVRHVVNIHSMRAYFHTKASKKHGSDYANALDGHGAYLKQYYREDPEERAKMYQELEPSLLIESYKLESEITKDKKIDSLQNEMKEMQAEMMRLRLRQDNP